MNRYALSFPIRPGTASEVAEILRSYRRPSAGAAPGGPPLLRRTTVFVGADRVVRVMTVAGEIDEVMRHLSSQPQIRAVEEALDPYLAIRRDLRTAAGVQDFLERALLTEAVHRQTPQEQLPEVTDDAVARCGLLYPVRPGCGKPAAQLLANAAPLPVRVDAQTAIVASSVYYHDDVLLRMFEVAGRVSDVLAYLARTAAAAPAAAELAELMETDFDLTTEAGFRAFLAGSRLELVTDRRVEVPA
ncbi:hypothetical protein JQS43_08605 [Natronosporangium hydrolyticum]|uniref:SchA/CurD-like domain-containing protein n=1 Tax=Natronosporangium hydrolyticum TaxID=2811111 RepID=A0A895YLZ3_9ACTN|nr:SchA/CurD-like domain-containing protein [Natronosporangium hydrolyticum]QSB16333.1 hypothetical protein JQS43_08605 [Natronosporangium hydrolyticum]